MQDQGINSIIEHISTYYPQSEDDPECELCFGMHSTANCSVPLSVLNSRREAVARFSNTYQNALNILRNYRPIYSHNTNAGDLNNINSISDLTTILTALEIKTESVEDSYIDCGVCFEPKNIKTDCCKYQCNHIYCKPCTLSHIKYNFTNTNSINCPSCRSKITTIYEFV
jgi:hypothetical protein